MQCSPSLTVSHSVNVLDLNHKRKQTSFSNKNWKYGRIDVKNPHLHTQIITQEPVLKQNSKRKLNPTNELKIGPRPATLEEAFQLIDVLSSKTEALYDSQAQTNARLSQLLMQQSQINDYNNNNNMNSRQDEENNNKYSETKESTKMNKKKNGIVLGGGERKTRIEELKHLFPRLDSAWLRRELHAPGVLSKLNFSDLIPA